MEPVTQAVHTAMILLDDSIHLLSRLDRATATDYEIVGRLVVARQTVSSIPRLASEVATEPPMPPVIPIRDKQKRKAHKRGPDAAKNKAWFTPCPTCGADPEQPCIRSVSNIHGQTGEPTKYLHRERGLGNGAIPNQPPDVAR